MDSPVINSTLNCCSCLIVQFCSFTKDFTLVHIVNLFLQDVFDDPAPTVNSAAVETIISRPEVDGNYSAEKGELI